MEEKERPFAERVDGVVVTLPAKRISFYLEPTKDIFGRPTVEIRPLMLPEVRTIELGRAVAEAIKGKREKVGEVVA